MNETASGTAERLVRSRVLRCGPSALVDPWAGQHRDEDDRRRQLIDAFNELDSMAHQVEHRFVELGPDACDRERVHGEVLVAEAYRMVGGPSGDLQQVQNQTGELRRLLCQITSDGTTAGMSQAATPPMLSFPTSRI